MGPWNRVLDWGTAPPREGTILRGEGAAIVKYRHSAVTYVKTAEPIVMPFGLWVWTGPRNHELDGGPDPT